MSDVCIYCGKRTAQEDFSDEHIWPSALGGDPLPDFWRTRHVCRGCNSISGVFVEGEFIKGLAGTIERYTGNEFVGVDAPLKAVFPLAYLGRLADVTIEDGHEAEYWSGPCGAIVIHLRPADREPIWSTYTGGDPRRQRHNGRVYLVLTSESRFWIIATLRSVKAHFKSQRPIYIVNAAVPHELAPSFQQPDPTDGQQSKDLATVREVIDAGKSGKQLKLRMSVSLDTGTRFLAKVALAVGYKVFGSPFLDTNHAKHLRQAFREADPQRRRNFRVRGVGYLSSDALTNSLPPLIGWPGAWVLALISVRSSIYLVLVTPSGRVLGILVSDDHDLVPVADCRFDDGTVWVVVPALGEAIGPIELPNYLEHQNGTQSNDQLATLEKKSASKSDLPRC